MPVKVIPPGPVTPWVQAALDAFYPDGWACTRDDAEAMGRAIRAGAAALLVEVGRRASEAIQPRVRHRKDGKR